MNRSNNYGSTVAGLGLSSYSVGTNIVITYPQTKFSWSFYISPATEKGGPRPRLEGYLTDSTIPFNSKAHPIAPGSNKTGPFTIEVNNSNHVKAVEAEVARIRANTPDPIVGDILTKNASPGMRNINGNPRDMDVSYTTENFLTGRTRHFEEIKSGVHNLSGEKGGMAGVQAPSDAMNLRKMNAEVANVRYLGQGMRIGGAGLLIGGTGFDVWNIVNIAQHPDPINDPDNYKLWSAVARSVPTEAGFWGSTVYGAVKAYDKYKPFAALEGGLKLGSRAAVPAMAAGTAAQIGYGIYEDGGKFGPHTQDVVYSNQRALLGAGVGGVVGAGLGALVPGLNLTGTSEWAGFVLGAEIGYGVGSLMDAGAAIIGEENIPSWGTVGSTIWNGVEQVFPVTKAIYSIDSSIVNWLTSPAEFTQSSSSNGAGQNTLLYTPPLLHPGFFDAGNTQESMLDTSTYANLGMAAAVAGFGTAMTGGNGIAGLTAGAAAYIAGLGMESGLTTDLGGFVQDTSLAYIPGWSSNAVFSNGYASDYASSSYNYASDYASSAYNYVSDYASSGYNYASDYASSAYNYASDYASSAYNYASDYYNSAYNYVSDYFSSSYGYGYDYGYTYAPVVLDLTGSGITITPLSSSNTFFDTAGDGRQHRTAWAGAGDAVLAIDADSDGAIDQRNEIVFTDWDPAAANDMQAIANVFDTNHNGLLDAEDAQFADFRLIVTNADGTTTLQTLAQAGIASIGLTPDATQITLPDGSTIDGQTTFTRTGGGTGTAATVTLASDGTGYVLQTAVTHNGDGSTTIANTALNADGSVASETILVTSADGATRTLSSDDDGDGVTDSVQTIATVTNGDGSATETLTNALPVGFVLNRTVTTTSADGNTIAIARDTDGDGLSDQTEARVTAADGSQTIAVTDLNPNGTAKRGQTSAVSADGLTRTDQSDLDGNGATDLTTTDATVVNGDASRTETVTATNANGTIRSRSVTARSADGSTKTVQTDSDGNGTFDLTQAFVIAFAADHASTSTETDTNADGSLRSKTVVDLSADGLSRTTRSDVTGDNVFDLTTTDVTVINPDGSRTQTITETNANGSLRSRTITARGADGISRTIQTNTNGDGGWDSVETIAVNGSNETVDTVSSYNVNGSLNSGTVTTTSADGLTVTTQTDIDGDGTADGTQTTVTVLNANGTSTVTETDRSADGTLLGETVTTTSADALSITTQTDLNGDAAFDITAADVTVVNGDGSRTQTVTARSANNNLLSWSEQIISADRKTTTITEDANGDGANDSVKTILTLTSGDIVDTLSSFNPNGSLLNRTITTTSANGLATTTQTDVNGDSIYDLTTTDVVTLGTDGSQTETVTNRNADTSLRDQTIVTTSDDGLSTTEAVDANGDGVFDLTTASSTVLGADGSRTTTVTKTSASGALIDRIVTTTSANGLSTTTQTDLNGDGTFDRIATDVIVLGADGSQTETVTNRNADNSLRDQTVTAVSADRLSTSITQDSDGDGHLDLTETIATAADGTTTDRATELAADGSVITATTQTTSADGLTVTTQTDIDGDGTADGTQTTVTVLNANGTSTVTETDRSADGTLLGETVTTTSADALSITTQTDLNGDAAFDITAADVTVVNGDGSRTQTVTARSANNNLLSWSEQIISADRKTTTITEDANGDGANDSVKTILTLTSGDIVDTLSSFNPNGSLLNRTITTTSANGLATTTQTDVNGDSIYDLTTTDVVTLGTDGSQTETVTNSNADTSLRDQTIVTTSDDGLSTTEAVDANGDGVFDLTTASSTVLGADGSRTTTVTKTSASGALIDRIVTTTSANGLSTTTQTDLNGDGTFDRIATDVIVLGADGSQTETVTNRNADNSLRDQTVTAVSADRLSTSITQDSDGDGHLDLTETIATAADGTTTDRATELAADGSVITATTQTTSADGLTVTEAKDLNGDGFADATTTTATTLNANGSTTAVASVYAGITLARQTTVETSADGLSITTREDANGDGVADLTTADVTVLHSDGSTTQTVTNISADGTHRDQITTEVSADGKTTTIWEGFSDDLFRKKTTISTQADGSQLTAITYPNVTYADDPHGYVRFQVNQQSVSASGLSSEIVIENEYSAQFQVTDVTALNTDGSRTRVMTDLDGAGYNATLTTSANGLSKSVQMTSAAHATGPALTLTATDITALGADGSTTQTIIDTITQTTSNFTTGTDRLVTTTSADGLTTSSQLDIDNDGDYDRSDTTITAVDGSKTETLSVYNPATGALQERTVTATSADGRSQSLERDSDGDGVFDHFETTAVNADGSQTGTVWNTDASGALIDRFVTTTSGDGLSKTTTSDVNGDGTIDYSQTSLTTLLADGRRVTGLSDFYGNGAVRHRTVTTTSADGLTTTVESDLSGDGIIDETQTSVKVLNADGTATETITTRYADGSLKNKTTTQDDTRRYAFSTLTEFDTDGDGIIERDTWALADQVNSRGEVTQFYNSDGTFRNSVSQGTSTDGSTIETGYTWLSITPEETIYYMPNANGSYRWTQTTLEDRRTSTHTIDLAGVDHWVYSEEDAASPTTTYHTVTIDLAAEKKAIEIARRLYDTALDRTMGEEEIQMLAKYITGGVLDTAALAGEVLDSDEFADKYGMLSNVQFVERIYDNAVGRAPSLAELSELVGQLNASTLTRAAALNLVSESQEHLIAGNDHLVTNNTTSGHPIALDRTIDEQIAGDIVRRIFDTALARRATAQEVAAYSHDILDGDRTEAEVATAILALPEFTSTYGTLTDTAFVAQIFMNALGRVPTVAESTFWTSALTVGTVSRADFLDGVARSSEHLSIMGTGSAIGGDGDDVIYAPDSAVDIDGGAGNNTVNYSLLSMPGVTVDLAAGTAIKANGNIDHLTNIQNVTGGSANDVITGDAGNNVLDGGLGTDTLTGGLGDDTYVADGVSDIIVEAAGGGTDTVQSSVTQTALAANVENITLTGTATINGTGNALDNILTGNSAVNTLTGGLGNDTYVVHNTADVVVEAAGAGMDAVLSSVTYTLAANVENLTLTGTSAINGTGNDLDNLLTGNSAVNTLTGGLGNDTYVVHNTADVVVEAAGAGMDAVLSSVTYTLAANVENLTLTGTSAINATGNTLDNVLTGNTADNILNGGAGVDALAGGVGNDTYVVDTATDVITELAGEGTDTVQSSVTQAGLAANVENLTLTGTSAISGTGNELDNILTGNSGANTLTGLGGNDTFNGGGGVDTLVGGAGDDIYVVDTTTDTITELAGGGTDTVQSSVTITALAANIENLTLTGTSTLNGTGNALDNVLTGNTGTNTLTGLAGNDTYVIQNTADVVVEAAGGGTDTIQSSVAYALGANVENLTLTGTTAINATGNELANILTGNSANNTLTGGLGADIFAFTGMFATDTVADFQVFGADHDIMQFDAAAFSSASAVLAAAQQVGNDVLITSGANSITLTNVAVANLTAENVQIV